MTEPVNLLSKAEIPLYYARRLNYHNNKHVLYWDYDEPEIDLEALQELVNELNLELHIIKTLNGYHLIDFHLFDIFEIEGIQKKLQKLLPSTYPTIKTVEELDTRDRQLFEGQTLRITKKEPGKDLIYFTCLKPFNIESIEPKFYSEGHQYIYKLVTEVNIIVSGIPLKTRINVCSYLGVKC